MYICVDFIQGAFTESKPSPRCNYTPFPPMKLMTSQSLPPSSVSDVMIMSQSIDLAGLTPRKNSLTLHYFLAWTLIKVTKSPLPTPLVFTQNKSTTHPRIGLGLGSLLTPSKTASPLVFFPATLAWTRAMPAFKRKPSGHLLAKSHSYIFIFFLTWWSTMSIFPRTILSCKEWPFTRKDLARAKAKLSIIFKKCSNEYKIV